MKIGVITYDSSARLRIPLRRYRPREFKRRVDYLSYYGGLTRTDEGLKKAAQQFHRFGQPGRKQILFVVTDGKSTTYGGTPGFVLTRRAALKLLNKGIHIVAMGVGKKVDPVELEAIASYPKQENVIRYGGFNGLVRASQRISATALKGRYKDIFSRFAYARTYICRKNLHSSNAHFQVYLGCFLHCI